MTRESKLFTPLTIGPLTLRNRTIRAAAFEGMCPGNAPSEMLHDYHLSVARGGIGMTTIAYAAVVRSGLSFPHQLWLRSEILTTAYGRYTCHGCGCIHTNRALREYVAQGDLWLHAHFRFKWF